MHVFILFGDTWIEKSLKMNYDKLRELVRNNQMISVRDLSKLMRCSQKATLEACEDLELNINIGMQNGAGYYVFGRKGDYTVEDLSAPAQKFELTPKHICLDCENKMPFNIDGCNKCGSQNVKRMMRLV